MKPLSEHCKKKVDSPEGSISSHVQLWPGDLIATGSPAGNGTHYKRFLRDGDVMDTEIEGLGRQRNPCVRQGRTR